LVYIDDLKPLGIVGTTNVITKFTDDDYTLLMPNIPVEQETRLGHL